MPADAFRLEIAGIGLTLRCRDAAFTAEAIRRYPGFLAAERWEPSGPDYALYLETSPNLLPGDESSPRVSREGNRVRMRRRDFHLEMDPAAREIRATVAGNVYSLDSLLRVLYSVALLEVDGLLLHGSCVLAADGGAHGFFGRSGAGKSTVARLSRPRVALSDELVVVRRLPEGFHAFGTPFWGNLESHGENRRAPLRALLSLVQDTEVFLRPLRRGEGFRRLQQCVLFFARQEPWVSQVVDLTDRLAREVPPQALHFRKDDTFWRLLEDVG